MLPISNSGLEKLVYNLENCQLEYIALTDDTGRPDGFRHV